MPDDVAPTVEPIHTIEGPATTAGWRQQHEDIGPFYKFLAFLAFLVFAGIATGQVIRGHPITAADIALYVLIFFLIMLLVRPDKFDNAIKTIADWMPFVKYKKPTDA